MKLTTHLRTLTFALAALLAATPVTRAADLLVFAAASLTDALTELAPDYTKATGDTLRFNLAASGALTRQIREGAPADVIISADELRVDQLENGGLLLAGTRKTVLANTLAIVVAAEKPAPVTKPADLAAPAVRRLAFGDPATVPAGTYSREYLGKLGLWDGLQAKSVYLANVRAVLAAVESGNADAGIVYKTDALISKKVKIAYAVSLEDGPAITYPAAVIKTTKSPEAAKKFAAWLSTKEAQAVFAKYGFLTPATKTPVPSAGEKPVGAVK
ncbi:MAG: molybdate ABC transporter substrate-binding protein [Puniceicoccales bacterium]|jgi:molybdate transport system substrate-binding protein|nr:molybdate ABC transporter substrate-binding protein [Puniceicoccales bacterium]